MMVYIEVWLEIDLFEQKQKHFNQSINIYFENVLIDIDIVVLMLVSSHFQDSHRQACFRDCPLRY